jgi:serine phosphatase RsbU (regulator of sigma subunit)
MESMPPRVSFLSAAGSELSRLVSKATLKMANLPLARREHAGAAREVEALQIATASFADTANPTEIADAVLTLGLRAVGAVSGAVLVYDDRLEELSVEESVGYPPDLLERLGRADGGASALAAVAEPRREPIFLESPDEARERFPAILPVFDTTAGTGAAVVPLLRRGEHVGSLLLVLTDDQPFSEDRTTSVLALGQLCQETLAHSRRQQAEHRIAETLQRSLLPARLAAVPQLDVAVRYLPRAVEADVGGDWYDQVVLDDGRVVLAVGDVAGSGVVAAAAMGRLRIVLKSYAVDHRSPAESLSHLDTFVQYLPEDYFATAVLLRLDPSTRAVEYASAGHPPPLLIPGTGGEARYLEGGLSPPIDAGYGSLRRTGATVGLSPGDALLLYTDGLVERRDRPIAQGMSLLARALRRSRGDSAERLVRRATDALLGDEPAADDVALLAVKLREER